MIERAAAWALLTEFTRGDSLRKHARAVEAVMREYARRYDADPEAWGLAGMLHDFDYEMHPTAPRHPVKGAEILISRGVPVPIVYAVLAHAYYSGMPRTSLMDRGERRLKDLFRPERVFQLLAPGLPAEFPPLRTLEAYRNNLPLQPTPLIGREKEPLA